MLKEDTIERYYKNIYQNIRKYKYIYVSKVWLIGKTNQKVSNKPSQHMSECYQQTKPRYNVSESVFRNVSTVLLLEKH